MSVSILYYKVTPEKISSVQLYELINTWIEELPVQKQQQIRKLRQQNDQVLSLAGLQLLKIGMKKFAEKSFSLKQLQFPTNNKPFIEGNIDFNISHSGDIACCVISDDMKVGIDIELQRSVKPATMNKFLSNRSTEFGKTEEEDKRNFFDLWTKNEAIIKAANYGAIYNMREISHNQETGYYQNHLWYTYPLNIDSADIDSSGIHLNNDHSINIKKEYTCHIACSEKIADSDLINIKPKQIHIL